MWLAAENGMFLRCTKGEWMTTMPEHLNMDWVDSVKVPIFHHCFVGNLMFKIYWPHGVSGYADMPCSFNLSACF